MTYFITTESLAPANYGPMALRFPTFHLATFPHSPKTIQPTARSWQLAMAGAFGTNNARTPTNINGWQIVKPPEGNGPGICNGYTYALRQTAQALGGTA